MRPKTGWQGLSNPGQGVQEVLGRLIRLWKKMEDYGIKWKNIPIFVTKRERNLQQPQMK